MVSSNNAIYNTVGASISGVTNTLTVTNPSNTAASSARETITVGGASSGDPTLNFNVSGVTNFEMGLDNSVAGDPFKISVGTSLGTNDTFIMTTAGERTMPLQPSFFAALSASLMDATGDGTVVTVIFDSEVFDQGGDYNNATGTFTAPITGRYQFFSVISFMDVTAGFTGAVVLLSINAATLIISGNTISQSANVGTAFSLVFSSIVSLTAADTVVMLGSVAGGAKTVDINASLFPASYQTYFSGALLH